MENESLSKLIPVLVLLFLGIIEALGGLYFNDRRTKNDFSIELLSLVTLPTFIQPGIFLLVLWFMGASFPGLEDYYLTSSLWWHVLAFLILDDLTQYWWHRLRKWEYLLPIETQYYIMHLCREFGFQLF